VLDPDDNDSDNSPAEQMHCCQEHKPDGAAPHYYVRETREYISKCNQ
jgi:hypothetical protein